MGEPVAEVLRRLSGHLEGQYVVLMLELGRRVGLLDAVAAGPGGAAEIAGRAGTHERSTREWLALLAAAGYLRHTGGVFEPAPGFEVLLDPRRAPVDVAVLLRMGPLGYRVLPELERSLRDGSGVPYESYVDFAGMQDRLTAPLYDRSLLAEWVPAVGGLPARLSAGVDVADLGCGAGHALMLLAAAYPASRFVGYELDEAGRKLATDRAAVRGLSNVEFLGRDVAAGLDRDYDVVLAFDTVHDLPDPPALLAAARQALRPGGVLVLVEPATSGDLDADIGRPQAVARYYSSLFHCMQVSLAGGGPGIGNGWPVGEAMQALWKAGFDRVHTIATATGQNIFHARA